ncbi:ParB/RepB/Spo0J family partition protein [Peptococcaceae bacterium 1198_IL3148]
MSVDNQPLATSRVAKLLQGRKTPIQDPIVNKTEDDSLFKLIPIDNVIPDPDQPRKTFSEDKLSELAASIKARGILQPIRVVPADEPGKYIIVNGERRWRAAKQAELKEVPAYIGEDTSKSERLIDGLVENIVRANLSSIEKANAIVEIQKANPQLSDKALAKKIGISRNMLYRLLNIHKLPEYMHEIFYAERLTDRHAKALLMLDEHKQLQEELFQNISDEKISGTEAIKLAEEWLSQITKKSPISKFYGSFITKISKIDKKVEKMDETEKNLMKDQIKDMKRLLDSLESKLK